MSFKRINLGDVKSHPFHWMKWIYFTRLELCTSLHTLMKKIGAFKTIFFSGSFQRESVKYLPCQLSFYPHRLFVLFQDIKEMHLKIAPGTWRPCSLLLWFIFSIMYLFTVDLLYCYTGLYSVYIKFLIILVSLVWN